MRLSTLLIAACGVFMATATTGRPVAPRHAAAADMVDSSNIDATFAAMQAHQDWAHWKHTHNKRYASADHEADRFAIFQENMKIAAELNAKDPSATFGMNQFSDIHPVEFKKQYLNYAPSVGDAAASRRMNAATTKSRHMGSIPTSYDWRRPDHGRPVGVTPVKDQGQCGSCWAFSATEESESAWILAGNKPVILAPEQTVDCDMVDAGCNGGDTITAYAYMEANGIQTEASYPYQAGLSGSAGTCNYTRADVAVRISGFTYATPGCNDTCSHQDEKLLATNLYQHGPVSICVDASTWQTYTGGILTSASGCGSAYSALDHCVQLVGYGVDDKGHKYWSVRNSWATTWGEQGYIRLAFGVNTCGVADEATQVQI